MNFDSERIRIQVPIFLLILAYLLALLYQTFSLRPDPQLVPLLVLVPAILITIAHTANLIRPGTIPSLGSFSDFLTVEESTTEEEDNPRAAIKDSILIALWFAVFVVSVFLVGFVLSTFLFSVLFLYEVGDQPLQRSLVTGVILAVFLYLIFIELINVRPLSPLIPLGFP